MKKIIVLLSIFIIFISCGSKKTLSDLGGSDGCPLERLDWMEVSEGYDSKTIIDLATKLEAAAKSDASSLKSSGKASGNITYSLTDIINKSGNGRIKVSQKFYETYVNKRLSICSIYQGFKDGLFDDAEAKRKAQDIYLELAKSFADVKSDEEKKNL